MSYYDETVDASLTIDPDWYRSSFCASGSCLEVATVPRAVLVRDSKQAAASPILTFDPEMWQAFVDAVKADALT